MSVLTNVPRQEPTLGYWCHGPTGSGKSRWAYSIPGTIYAKNANNKWFDGYHHQDTVILDDYRPNKHLDFNLLLNLADRYPLTVERKGGTLHFNSKRLVITTPYSIDKTFEHLEWIQGSIDQLKRRFTEVDFTGETPMPLQI